MVDILVYTNTPQKPMKNEGLIPQNMSYTLKTEGCGFLWYRHNTQSLGNQSPKLRMGAWNLNPLCFGGDERHLNRSSSDVW